MVSILKYLGWEEKYQQIKSRICSFLIILLWAGLAFFIIFNVCSFLMLFMTPKSYFSSTTPQFVTKKSQPNKIISMFENSNLKKQLCIKPTYVGTNMNFEEVCVFKYKQLPLMDGMVDVNVFGVDYKEFKRLTVCLLKRPLDWRHTNETRKKNYVCQKYQVEKEIHILNDLLLEDVFFVDVELELQNGVEVYQGDGISVSFFQEKNFIERFVIDYYYFIGLAFSWSISVCIAIVILIFGLSAIYQKSEQKTQKIKKSNDKNDKVE